MDEGSTAIDVWNVETFGELCGDLDLHADVILDYMITSRRQWLERQASGHTMRYPENPSAGEFMWGTEHIVQLMEARTIRAWHYTRLIDAEIDTPRRGGIYPSSLDTLRSALRGPGRGWHFYSGSRRSPVRRQFVPERPGWLSLTQILDGFAPRRHQRRRRRIATRELGRRVRLVLTAGRGTSGHAETDQPTTRPGVVMPLAHFRHS
ncbi:hypothetical protein WBP07_20175 (plasmid) [Novosphingobium sp. BL-8A]|uniref:hypothetical protein n=1 Tax=Novosphingobium sp. BL-8A TaxID=3127639 RepID=UPI0037565866